MSVLVCGSLAFDTIMVFPGRFREHILTDQMHILNVSFLVPEMRREFGGTAGNIAYNLRLLGEQPLVMATVGHDFAPYAQRFQSLGLSMRHVRTVDGQFTGQAFITTDIDDNQITAFHPGAMGYSHYNRVSDASGVKIGIVSPEGRDGMIQHAHELAAAKIPYVFDPGQGLPMFSGTELLDLMTGARALAVNDYEARIVEQKTGRTISQLTGIVDAVIVTRGAEGSVVHSRDGQFEIPPVPAERVVDPTGCGDAFRAGLLHGMARDWPWRKCARLGSVMGAIKISHRGGQNHTPSRDVIAEAFRATYSESL
jgi:adenosine kinase